MALIHARTPSAPGSPEGTKILEIVVLSREEPPTLVGQRARSDQDTHCAGLPGDASGLHLGRQYA